MDFIKAERVGKNKWRVLSIPFGGPKPADKAGRPDNGIGFDLDDEFFSPRTDIKADWFDRRPLVWHHNLDESMKTADDTELEDDGWWSTVWLDRSHRYWEHVNGLLETGKVFGSSGSIPTFVRTDHKTGEILVWPFIEQTLTPTPANPFARVVPAKALAHFDEANIGLPPAVRGLLSTDLEPSSEADLPVDLPEQGGDAAAIRRLAGELARLEELIQKL
jgi:hypothetical protein